MQVNEDEAPPLMHLSESDAQQEEEEDEEAAPRYCGLPASSDKTCKPWPGVWGEEEEHVVVSSI